MQRPTMDLSQYVGARVVRGEHWRWGEQDGGEGHMGVVRAFEPPAQVVIVWDNGTAANYRCGPIATDLRVLDSAPSGNFKHEGITCSACKTQPIFGDRWQCAQCEGVNLCSTCYHGGRHSVRHSFYRLAHLNATVTHSNDTTPPRRGARTVTCKGLAPGAKVKRGPDWDWGDQDGGLGCVGKIVRLHAWMEGRVRSAAYVRWSSTGNENLYRLGVDGLMDLKCIAPAKGYTYYVDHLSPLGGSSPGNAMGSPLLPPSPQNHSNSPHFLDHLYPSANESGIVPISLGDAVVVAVDVATLQHMQAGHGEWNDQMCECICSSGTVIDFDADGDAVVFYAASGNRWTLNTAALCRANGQTAGVNGDPLTLGVGGDSPALGGAGEREGGTQFSVGDHVRLAASAARVRALQHGHGGWAEGMLSAVGRRGTVSSVFADGDIAVRMADGRTWTLNPTCVAPAAAMQHAVLTPQSSAGPADAIVSQQLNSAMGEGVTSENSTGHMATLLRRLFDEQTSPSTPSSVQEELIKAAALGDCDTCSKLLGCKDVHVDSITEVDVDALCAGHTALQAAAQHGHLDVVRMLVKLAGAGVSVADADGDTPVHHAAYGDEPAAVQLLHSLGADINARNGRGQTPLHIAVNVGAAAVVRTLLKLNAIADLQDTDGDTPLHDAVARRREDVVKALAQAGAQLALANNKGFSPLHTAALRANAGATRVLISQILRRGEPWLVDQCKEDGYTPLHVAALNGHVQVAELLVGKGKADVDRLNHSNQTPLHLAVHKQHFSIVRLLVRNGRAQVNPKDKDGDTPLHEALRRHTMDQLELLTDVAAVGRLLIGARADADSHLSDNVPPSPETKSDQRQEEQQQPQSTIVGDQPISVNLATFLVSNGADLTVKNKKGQTPLDLCADAKMCKLLVQCQKDRLTRRMNTSKQRSSISNSSPRAVGTLPSSDALNAPNRRLSSTSNNGANNGAGVSASMVRHFYTVPNNELESEQIDSECFVCKCRPISRQSLRCFHAYLCEVCCAPKSAPKSCPICAAEQFVSGEAYRELTDKCRVCDGAVTFVGARAHDERRGMQLVVFRPCGHSLVCRGCGEIVKRCLECRAPVQSISGLLENVAGSETTQARQILNNRRRSVDTPSARSGASVALRGGKRRNSGTELSKMQAELGELRDLARCPVCLDRRKKMVFPCGHACCQFCGDALVDCPICRRKIENKILLY